MRWVLTWKVDETEGSTKAKARLVVKGFTDPDLTTLRSESPTLSRLAKHWLLQVAASSKWTIAKGDVKTAFLQGGKQESLRNVFVDPPLDVRKYLGLTQEQILKLESSVYGLRNAPRAWFERISKDLLRLGWRQHQLDSCLFMAYSNT